MKGIITYTINNVKIIIPYMQKLTTQEFIQKATKLHKARYSYEKSEYTNAITKLIITCSVHGDFLQRPNDHLSGLNGCPKCKSDLIGNIKRKDVSSLLEQFQSIHGNIYDYSLVQYVNGKKTISVICKHHGIFNISPNKHISGQGCSQCAISNGERLVIECLNDLGISYTQQKTFPDLKGHFNQLKYDFHLPDHNILIEYDGEFHFFHHKCFNYKNISNEEAIARFLKVKEYDARKNTYAEQNKIYLLRIPYTVYTKATIKKIIVGFINYSASNLPEFDDSFSYVEMLVPKHPQFRG